MHKRKTLLCLTSALALALSGCAGGGAGSGETVTIDYLHRLPDAEGMVKISEIVDRWNKEHPNIQVRATKFDGQAEEMINKIQTDVQAGNAPCLAQVGYSEVPELFVKGAFTDVTEHADKYKDNYSGAFGQMSVGGVTVGLPQDTGPLVYTFNEAEFEKLGLKVPTTIDELKTAAKAAAAKGKYVAVFSPDQADFWLSAQSAAAGDVWYMAEGDKWKVNTTGEGSKRVAALWQELIDANAVLVADRWSDAFTKALTDGKIIGHIAGAWETGFLLDPLDGTPQEGQWRVTDLPDMGAGALSGPYGGSGVAVLKGCAHPAEAMEFNDWFEQQVDDLATQGLVPAATKPARTPEKMSKQFGGQDVMAQLMKANDALPEEFGYAPGFSAVGPRMVETAANASQGKATMMEVFEEAHKASVEALKAANLPVAEE